MALEGCQMVFRDDVQTVFRCLGIRLFGCRGRLDDIDGMVGVVGERM